MNSLSHTGKSTAKGIDDALDEGAQIKTTTAAETAEYLEMVKQKHSLDSPSGEVESDELPWDIDPIEPQEDIPLPDLCIENLPKELRQTVLDTCSNLQVPIIFIVTALIAAFCGIIGSAFRIRPKKYDKLWSVCLNIWGILIGPPSVKKSPTLEEGLNPLKHIDKLEEEKYQKLRREWESTEAKLKAEKDGIADAIKAIARGENSKNKISMEELESKLNEVTLELAKAPKRRVLKTNDATQEAILAIEAVNKNGVALHRDELVGWLSKIDSDKDAGAKQFVMEGFIGGQSYRSNRVTKEGPSTDSHTITIVGTTQPRPYGELIRQMKKNPFAEDGFTQRFQFAALYMPKEISLPNDVRRDPIAEAKLLELSSKIYKWVEEVLEKNERCYQVADYTEEAQSFVNQIQLKLYDLANEHEDNSHYFAHIQKVPKSVHGLALLFELISQASEKSKFDNLVGIESLKMAWACVQVYLKHAEKIYQLDEMVSSSSSNELLRRIKNFDIKDKMTLRDLKRKNWKFLRNEKDLNEAIEELGALGWCRVEKNKKQRGAPSAVLRLHPSLRK